MNQAAKAARDCADEIAQYLRTLSPLKFADIKLSRVIKPPSPMYEVVMPGYRRPDFSLGGADVPKMLTLIDKVRRTSARKRKTFGRGQLKKIV
jgi:hypothetical protein